MNTRADAGMTLVEMMVVVAIVGILATMAVVELLYGTGRARLNNATWEISALSSVAQMRAAARGFPNYIVFYEADGETGVLHLEREERSGIANLVWNTVDPLDPDTFVGTVIPPAPVPTVRVHDRLRFSGPWGRRGMRFESLAGFSLAARPPYWAISTTPAGASGLMAACSFCEAGGNGSFLGAIRYAPDGTVSIETGPGAPLSMGGGAVALATDSADEAGHPRLIAFSMPTGAVNVIYRD
jgi:prepilin-type N-terminal cleavage/methylation domain-containing protein